MDTCKQVSLIETTIRRRGDGYESPVRIITEYWTMDGKKVAEVDPSLKQAITRLVLFAVGNREKFPDEKHFKTGESVIIVRDWLKDNAEQSTP